MKTTQLLLLTIFSISSVYAQKGFPKYYEMLAFYNTADSLYKAGNYSKAAEYFQRAGAVKVEKGIELDYTLFHYNAASCWSLAKRKSKAFDALNLLVNTMGYSSYSQISNDTSFAYLHSDKRWESILKAVKANEDDKKRIEEMTKSRTTFIGSSKEVLFNHHTAKMREYLDNDSLPFISINHSVYRIYFRGNSYAAAHLTDVKQQIDVATQRIFSVLQPSDYNKGVNLVLVDSAGELQQLTGMYVHGGFALEAYNLVFIVCNSKRKAPLKHEIFHFISTNTWGLCTSRLLNEGGAVFTENECGAIDNPVYSIAAYLLRERKLFPLQSLIDNFDNLALNNEVIAYYQSAAIFKYLYEQYGIEKMKRLWTEGFIAFETIYGKSISQFENEWNNHITTIVPPENLDWEKLSKQGCD